MPSPFNDDPFIAENILRLRKIYNLRDAIETGTHLGTTSRWLAANFERCFTVELDPNLVRSALNEGPLPNLAYFLGNSPEVISALAPVLTCRCLVYLDAHGTDYWPLLDELTALRKLTIPPVIAIHDFKVPDCPDLGFDSYRGQALEWDYVADAVAHIYGKSGFSLKFNTVEASGGAQRGIIYITPVNGGTETRE
jgi:hypothetical protein